MINYVNKVSFKNPSDAPAPDGWSVTLHRKTFSMKSKKSEHNNLKSFMSKPKSICINKSRSAFFVFRRCKGIIRLSD